jgi:hypothetical protein
VYVSFELSEPYADMFVPAEPYTLSLTELVKAKLTLPPALALVEVIEGAPDELYTVSVNMNVPGELSVSLGCNDKV